MKAIFYIHSHTCFLTTLGVIEYEALVPSDVIFIYTRNYKNDLINIPYVVFDYSDYFKKIVESGFNFLKINQIVIEIDKKIEEDIGDSYLVYLPHVGVPLMQIIASHQLCKGIAFIEEGVGSYAPNLLKPSTSIREIVKSFYSLIIPSSGRFWFTYSIFKLQYKTKTRFSALKSYAISKDAFLNLDGVITVKVDWPKTKVDVQFNQDYPIFIFDAAIEQNFATRDSYLLISRQMISQNSKSKSYVKFHPAQSKENIKIIRSYFSEFSVDCIELPQNIPFECILTSFKNLSIVGFGSSLIFYAKLLNNHIVSYDQNLQDIDSKYKRYREYFDYQL